MDLQLKATRCEIADLYFWLGKEAELVGFTSWQTVWLVDGVASDHSDEDQYAGRSEGYKP